MSLLRKQIEKARAEYLAGAYPGNLADDVLNPRPMILTLRRVAAAMAMAAMVLLAWAIWPTPKAAPTLVSIATTQAVPVASAQTVAVADSETFSLTGIEVPDLTSISGTSMVPVLGSMTVPQVPAITDVTREEETTSTTKETAL